MRSSCPADDRTSLPLLALAVSVSYSGTRGGRREKRKEPRWRSLCALLPQRGFGGGGSFGGGSGLGLDVLALPAELEGQGDLNLLFRQAPRARGPRRCRLS